ncbi:SEL1-like repeat protein [Thalassovita sp.]|jgi:TPR repeat protein|uniref:SEL1-like repeat protein n=1 Tax=Thalassovita sp. TaxID=1979401 RepID=UPI003B5CF829
MMGARITSLVFAALLMCQPVALLAQEADADLVQAAQSGQAEAQYQLGMQYGRGEGVLQNHARAVEWLTLAARQGHAAAQNRLGQHLFVGMGVEQAPEAALEWFAKAAASGKADFQADYGDALIGIGRAQEAAAMFQLAADQGHLNAMTSLGVLYQSGNGVPKDPQRARALFEGPAAAGVARAQNNLGSLYVRGDGVAQDYERAAQLFQSAAEQGLKEAMTNLGVMYENGFGVPLDEAKAHELYRMGGRGEEASDKTLTFPLYEPRLQPLDAAQEISDGLQSAARLGDPVAQFQLAWLLLQREELSQQDLNLIVQLMQSSAQAGLRGAQANLGWMYFQGIGVPQDYVLGHMWLLLASASGDPDLKALNAQLSRDLLASQIEEAQSLAASYVQSQ